MSMPTKEYFASLYISLMSASLTVFGLDVLHIHNRKVRLLTINANGRYFAKALRNDLKSPRVLHSFQLQTRTFEFTHSIRVVYFEYSNLLPLSLCTSTVACSISVTGSLSPLVVA